MRAGKHDVTCDEDKGTLVRINGICVAHFTELGFLFGTRRWNQLKAADLARRIVEAIQRGEGLIE